MKKIKTRIPRCLRLGIPPWGPTFQAYMVLLSTTYVRSCGWGSVLWPVQLQLFLLQNLAKNGLQAIHIDDVSEMIVQSTQRSGEKKKFFEKIKRPTKGRGSLLVFLQHHTHGLVRPGPPDTSKKSHHFRIPGRFRKLLNSLSLLAQTGRKRQWRCTATLPRRLQPLQQVTLPKR